MYRMKSDVNNLQIDKDLLNQYYSKDIAASLSVLLSIPTPD